MIVRVKFEGIVEFDGTRSILPDYVDIHMAPEKGLLHAKEIFLSWLSKGTAIRGADNDVFHPLSGWGDIKIKNVVEMVGGEEEPVRIPSGDSIVVKAKKGKTTVRPEFPMEETCPKEEVSLLSPTQEILPPLPPKTRKKK